MKTLRTLAALFLALAVDGAAQEPGRVGTAAIFEEYRLEGGSATRISELTMPVWASVRLGSRASLAVSGGYVSVALQGADSSSPPSQRVDGPLDSEARLELDLLRDRLRIFVATRLPTGREQLRGEEVWLALTLANDAVGFAASSLGSGANVSAGFSTAVPVGRFAFGLAAVGTYSWPYAPIVAEPTQLGPGFEARWRVGLEGALASGTYLRIVGSTALRGRDRIDGAPTHALGHRAIGYVALEQRVGAATLSVYGFDVYRGSPQLEANGLGAAILPRGNLVATGLSIALPLGSASLAPMLEYRSAWAALAPDLRGLHRQSTSLRAGAELRRRFDPGINIVALGQFAVGDAREASAMYDFRGYRAGMILQLIP